MENETNRKDMNIVQNKGDRIIETGSLCNLSSDKLTPKKKSLCNLSDVKKHGKRKDALQITSQTPRKA